MQENPCSFFYLWKNTLHLNPDPDLCARIRILGWDRLNIEKIFENQQNAGEPLPIFFMTEKHLSKFLPKGCLDPEHFYSILAQQTENHLT